MARTPLCFVFIFVLLGIGLFTALQVPAVQRDIVSWMIGKALNEPHQKVTVEQVKGLFPFSLYISRLSINSTLVNSTLADQTHIPSLKKAELAESSLLSQAPSHAQKEPLKNSPWLILEGLTLRLTVLPFKISLIHLQKLTLQQIPVFENRLEVSPAKAIAFVLGQRYLEQLCLESFEISPQVLGQPLYGKLEWFASSSAKAGKGPTLNLQTSLGGISATFLQTQQNKLTLQNLKVNFQDYHVQGQGEFNYDDQLQPLGANFALPNLKDSVGLTGLVTWQDQQNFKIEGKVDLKKLDLIAGFLGQDLHYSLSLIFTDHLIKAKVLHLKTPDFHSLEGDFCFDRETKQLKGKAEYALFSVASLSLTPSPKVKGTVLVNADSNSASIKLKTLNPGGSAQIIWKQNQHLLSFECNLPKLATEGLEMVGLLGKGEINSDLTGKAMVQIEEGRLADLAIKKSLLTVTLNKGKGEYQIQLPSSLQGLDLAIKSKGQLNLESDKPTVKGEVTLRTAIPRSKKKTGKLVNKELEIQNHFKWELSEFKFDSIYQPFSASPFKVKGKVGLEKGKILPSSSLDIKILGQFNLLTLMPWLSNGDRISGDINSDFRLTGTLGEPILHGWVDVKNGFYEIAEFGTCIGNIAVRLQAQGKQLAIQNLQANDGTKRENTLQNNTKRGTLVGRGLINIKQLTKPFFDIVLTLNDFQIAASDSFFSRARGEITLKGGLNQANVEGDLTLDPAGLFLEEINPISKIPTLKLIEEREDEKEQQDPKEAELKTFPLNLKLKVPQRFLIRGFGLDSLWGGEVDLKGYLTNPRASGGINLVKGKLELLGKTLKIIQGKITYSDEPLEKPHLLIVAVKEVGGVTLQLKIEGTAANPRFIFTSSPALTQEEILSRLLFGKELNKISTAQSLQLATIVASLNGKKGFNLAERIRNVFGLDTLEIKETIAESEKANSQAVAIGKEIGNVYFSVEKTLGGRGGKATVSIPLTSSLNCDIDVGGSQSSGVGLTWVKRY